MQQYMAIADVGHPADAWECFVTDGEWTRVACWYYSESRWFITLGPRHGERCVLWFKPTHWVIVEYPESLEPS